MRFKSFIKKMTIYFILVMFFLVESGQAHSVSYAANLSFYNFSAGSSENYTGKQVIYTYNGRELPLTYPGILINGTALADYEELFVTELGLKASIIGDSLIFSDGSTELILTLGSNKVIKNGISDTMSVAPVKLKFGDTVKYYVPTRYVAETFGFGYVWVSSISTVRITKTLNLTADSNNFTYNGTLYALKYQNQRISTNMPAVFYEGNVIVPAQQVFESAGCTYFEDENSITITKNELSLHMDKNSKIAYVNEKKIISDSIPLQITDNQLTQTYVSLEFVSDMLGFTLSYTSKDCCYNLQETENTGSLALYPDLKNNIWKEETEESKELIEESKELIEEQQPLYYYYEWNAEKSESAEKNYLSRVVAYSIENADVVELYGITRNDINDFYDNGLVVFEINSAVSTDMGTQFYSDYLAPHLTYTLLTSVGTNLKLFFIIPFEDEWAFVEKENCVQVYFTHSDLSAKDLRLSSSELSTKTEEATVQEKINKLPDDRLLIPIAENVDISNISDEDMYWNKQINLYIDGNHEVFYTENYIINPYYCVRNSNIYYDKELNKTVISITTKSICGYQYTIENGYLVVTLGRPDEIFSKILVLDAGHGGIDPGASKSGFYEKNLNFTILNTYAKELFDNSDIKVYFTRVTDVKIDLYERAAFASEVGADMFISLHMNANNTTSVKGTEVYYSKENNTTLESGFNSYQLAKTLAANLSSAMDTKNRGASNSEFVVVKYNTVPAVLIELGYMTNATELSKLTNTVYQKKAAETIFQTVNELFDTVLLR